MTDLNISSEITASSDVAYTQSALSNGQESDFLAGFNIFVRGFSYWSISVLMATSEIRRRYRRTLFGPFWVTLSVAIFITTMGMVFPILWHMKATTFLPYFASGYILWIFISGILTESGGTFIDLSGLIKQVVLPYSVYANSLILRNILIFSHHFVVYLIVMILFKVPINLNTLFIFPAMLIVCFTGSWVAILFGLITARFRDVRQIIMSLLQIGMFVTPILWMPSQLGSIWYAKLIVMLNPLTHFIIITRAPLLGQPPIFMNWVAAVSISLLGWLITMKLLGKYHRHLVFWL